jgi:hypothetical protein
MASRRNSRSGKNSMVKKRHSKNGDRFEMYAQDENYATKGMLNYFRVKQKEMI